MAFVESEKCQNELKRNGVPNGAKISVWYNSLDNRVYFRNDFNVFSVEYKPTSPYE